MKCLVENIFLMQKLQEYMDLNDTNQNHKLEASSKLKKSRRERPQNYHAKQYHFVVQTGTNIRYFDSSPALGVSTLVQHLVCN